MFTFNILFDVSSSIFWIGTIVKSNNEQHSEMKQNSKLARKQQRKQKMSKERT
jgi:hypothetical protein